MLKKGKFITKRRGGATIVAIGVAGVIMLFALFFLELVEMYDYQYAVEVRAQRAINSCVEYSMDDAYRADGFNFMDIPTAQDTLFTYLNEDLNVDSAGRCMKDGQLLYSVEYGTPTYYSGKDGHDAGIVISITVHMQAGLGRAFGTDGYTWTNTFSSTNFRTDDDMRRGTWPY